ncbi:MAG: hypothetical protein AB9869_24550 [Verrucomicrobiia bacterium]
MNNPNLPVPSLPSTSTDLVSSKGNVIGRRYVFGSYSAAELKAVLKAQGHTGRKLTEKVNEALRNESAQRQVVLSATAAELFNRGYVPDIVDVKVKAAQIKWVKPAALKPGKSKGDAAATEANAKLVRLQMLLAKLGVSEGDIAAAMA